MRTRVAGAQSFCSTPQLPTSCCRKPLQSHSSLRREESRPAPLLLSWVFPALLGLSLDPSRLLEKIKLTFPREKRKKGVGKCCLVVTTPSCLIPACQSAIEVFPEMLFINRGDTLMDKPKGFVAFLSSFFCWEPGSKPRATGGGSQ